jgi:hypothetical protein
MGWTAGLFHRSIISWSDTGLDPPFSFLVLLSSIVPPYCEEGTLHYYFVCICRVQKFMYCRLLLWRT